MNAPVSHFLGAAEWTGVMSHERARWLAARRELLTASDTAAILGEDQHKSALSVYVDKVIQSANEEVILIDDPRFWGGHLEQPILRVVAEYYRWDYHSGGALLRSRQHPRLGATLDAEINRGEGWEDFEGKTTRVPAGWDQESGDLPRRVLIQVQHQLLVTGAPRAIVFALLQGSRPVQIEILPSPAFHQVIVEHSEAFFERLRRMDPPPPDHTESARQAIYRLHPKDSGAGVVLPELAGEWSREIKQINAELKRLDARKSELQNLLRASIGSATYGLLPDEGEDGQRGWKLGLEERPEHTVKASSSRVLRAVKNIPPVQLVSPTGEDTGSVVSSSGVITARRSIEELIAASSLADDAPAERIRATKRRRARR